MLIVLVLPQVAGARGRTVFDRGVNWEGDWFNPHGPGNMFIDGDYIFYREWGGIRLVKIERTANGGFHLPAVDYHGDGTAEYGFIENRGIVVCGYPPELSIFRRVGDQLAFVDTTIINTGYLLQITDDSLMVTSRGIVSLKNLLEPEMIWDSPEFMEYGSTLYNNHLILYNYSSGRVIIYDVSDLTNTFPIDTCETILSGVAREDYPLDHIGNTFIFNSRSDFDHGVLIFRLDDTFHVESEYFWGWKANIHPHAGGRPFAAGVLNDSLFAVVNLIDGYLQNEPTIVTFDPDLLPGNPEVGRYRYDYDWFPETSGWQGVSMNIIDSLLYIDIMNSTPSMILNLQDIDNPEILYQNTYLVEGIIPPARFYDMEDGRLLASSVTSPTENYNGTLMVVRLNGETIPDTIAVLDQIFTDNTTVLVNEIAVSDTTLLVPRDFYFTISVFDFAPDGRSWQETATLPYNYTHDGDVMVDLQKMGNTTYAAVLDDSLAMLYQLGYRSAEALDTVSFNDRIREYTWTESGLFISTTDSVYWYQIDDNGQLALIDRVYDRLPLDIVQEGGLLGIGFNLYTIVNGSMERIHEYPYTIRCFDGTRLGISDNAGLFIMDFAEGDYENQIAYSWHGNQSAIILEGDDLYLWREFFAHYTLTGSMSAPEPTWAGTEGQPASFGLLPAWPNPFNASTHITVRIPTRSDVTLSVYNLLGREVTRLHHGPITPGLHTYPFNASGLGSGVYFVRLQTPETSNVQKVMLVK